MKLLGPAESLPTICVPVLVGEEWEELTRDLGLLDSVGTCDFREHNQNHGSQNPNPGKFR